MAISKIMHMKDSGKAYHGKHLKRSIDYISEGWKTQDQKLVGTLNCLAENVYKQMSSTKEMFGKNSGRQGYHLVLSFKPGEADVDSAFEIAGQFSSRYLGSRYETVYSVHDNTDCIHAHIVWNSVSFVDGRKYHYKKGDWEREILPITNELCREYGLSELELDGERANEEQAEPEEQRYRHSGTPVWNSMIKRDLDACILQASTFEEWKTLLKEKGYEWKEGKHMAVKPPGMERFRRCSTLGEAYTEERIRMRIRQENIGSYAARQKSPAKLVRCRIKRYHRAKLSGLQKKYYYRAYRLGLLKKRPYSQAWKYMDEIKKLGQIQKQYLFLQRYEIRDAAELVSVISLLSEQDKQAVTEKKLVYRERQRFQELFELAGKMQKLQNAHRAYEDGDNFFFKEEEQWRIYEEELKKKGYSYEEVVKLQMHFKQRIAAAIEKQNALKKELATGNAIWQDLKKDADERVVEVRAAEVREAAEGKEEKKFDRDRTHPMR